MFVQSLLNDQCMYFKIEICKTLIMFFSSNFAVIRIKDDITFQVLSYSTKSLYVYYYTINDYYQFDHLNIGLSKKLYIKLIFIYCLFLTIYLEQN